VSRFKARIAALRGDAADAERLFRGATGLFRELAVPFHLAVAQLELAELLVAHGRDDDAGPLLAEVRGVFEHLAAEPWLERVAAVEVGTPTMTPAERMA
jgi:hypothetical protein